MELVEAFNALSAGDREVLSLVTWQELKPREAATVLGISPALFSVRLHRARARLRKELERAGHNPVNATAPPGAAATPPDPTQLRTESE
jgi:DNA-directed RNA polymerase specialized sigma24 family protein